MKIFCIYDSKAEAYMQPFFTQAAGVAIREFGNLVEDEGHAIGQHPEDYTLFEIGEWEELEGVLKGDVPKARCNGLDFKSSKDSYGGTD